MASIITYPSGRRAVQFYDVEGQRRTVGLGKASRENAQDVRGRIERILAARIAGCSIDRDTAAWLADVGETLRAKLVDVGLIDARADQAAPVPVETLGPF